MTLFSLSGYLVVQTFYVTPRQQPPHHEIILALDEDPGTPRLAFVSRDEDLIAAALLVEGWPHRVDVTWRSGRKADGTVAQILTTITPHRRAA
jgi:hypothetical protein